MTELGGDLPRAGRPAERHERRLLQVFAHRLSRDGRVSFDVEQVVDDLKRQPEVLGKRLERGDRITRRAGGQRAGGGRGAEQRSGLAAVNPFQHLEADALIGGQQIGGLSADQAVAADGIRHERGQLRGEHGLVATRDGAEGRVEQTERRENRDRLARTT